MTGFSRALLSHQKPFSSAAPPSDSVTLQESEFVLVLAALLCALLCVVGLVAAARCAWCRHRNANRPSSAANKGVKKKVLRSLPKYTYTKTTKLAALSSAECAICLGEFAEGDEMRMLPQCGHGFHVVCIDRWLASHSSCPSCRQILVVARCQNCGQFPAGGPSAASDGGASVTQPQVKAEDDNNNNNNNWFLP